MKNINDLRLRTQKFNNALPFMEGREKGDFGKIKEIPLTIDDYGFLSDSGDEYIAFTVKEDKQTFFFGGMVLTEQVKTLDDEGYGDTIRSEGLPVIFTDKMGKNKRTYTAVTFFPEI